MSAPGVPEASYPEPSGPGDPELAPAPDPGRSPRSRAVRTAVEWGGVILLALLAAFLVKTFVLQTFFIPSASMQPTLEINDRVFVNKLAYAFHPVHRGDIVVFTLPPGESAGPDINDLIKRVIGLPGETISSRGNQIYINGKPLSEPWLPKGIQLGPPVDWTKGCLHSSQDPSACLVPPDHYFLMGDNRDNSRDSRFFGPIPGNLIVGRAFVRIWPFSRLGFL